MKTSYVLLDLEICVHVQGCVNSKESTESYADPGKTPTKPKLKIKQNWSSYYRKYKHWSREITKQQQKKNLIFNNKKIQWQPAEQKGGMTGFQSY